MKGPGEQCDLNDSQACPLKCNADCTCPHCGDGKVNAPGEQCDGAVHTACGTSPCQPDCTRPPPVCGDGRINQASEQCDGAADAACPGLCQADCTCPAPVCGNGVVEAGEQCDGSGLVCDLGGTCEAPDAANPCSCCYDICYYETVALPCCPGTACVLTGTPHIEGICVQTCTAPADCPSGGCNGVFCCSPPGTSCTPPPVPSVYDPCCNGCNPATSTCN